MADIKNIIVDESGSGMRLDAYLAQVNAYPSRSIASKMCSSGQVKVNGKNANKKLILNEADTIDYLEYVKDGTIKAQDIPLDIKYEDEHIMVISKQPYLVCHPAPGHTDSTLVNALIFHCGADNLFKPDDDDTRLGIVHRLDADTSGLMIIAKSDKAGRVLQKAMKDHSTERHYKALVYGAVKQDSGRIEVPLMRTVNKRPKMMPSNDARAKSAVTSFKVLERYHSSFGDFSMLDCKIHTGRTHQIRTHMEYINHGVVGDQLYNRNAPAGFDPVEELGLKRQFLHSYRIEFEHPITGESMKFSDELPQDLQVVLNKIAE